MRFFSRWLLIIIWMNLELGRQPQEHISTDVVTTTSSLMTILGQHEHEVQQRLTLINEGAGQPEKQNIWVALIRDFSPYQEVMSMEISPADHKIIIDEYGNEYAEFDFSKHPAGTTKTIKIDYRVAINELTYDLSNCEGQLLDNFNQPELHIESANPQIVALANELSRDQQTICQQVRTFYDFIGDELGRASGTQADGSRLY